MERDTAVAKLKQQLLTEVGLFFRHDDRRWKEPILQTLRDLKGVQVKAVCFGGTPRSLLLSRLFLGRLGRPRDIDIVVSGVPLEQIEEQLQDLVAHKNRFGGLRLSRGSWQFDVWPLSQTWAFMRDGVTQSTFAALPSTTTFNLEAIAVDVWSRPGHSRDLFSGNDQFFDGILTRTLELNREDSPFPELTVTRALVMASSIRFGLGPRLAAYIAEKGVGIEAEAFHETQIGHYGHVRLGGRTLRELAGFVGDSCGAESPARVSLPDVGQLEFWPEEPDKPSLNVHVLK